MEKLPKELIEMRANAKLQMAERNNIKEEEANKIIDSNNKLRSIVASFQKYVDENYAQLIGKKLFLATGENSKVLIKFFGAWKETIELSQWDNIYFNRSNYSASTQLHISLTVWGGHGHEKSLTGINTIYNTNIENTIWDIIKINKFYEYDGYDMTERFTKDYTSDGYNGAKLIINNLKEQIKSLENMISEYNEVIPPQLREK